MSPYSQLSSLFRQYEFESATKRLKYAIAEINKKTAEGQFISKAFEKFYPAALSPLTALQARAVGQVAFFKTYGVKATVKDWVKP